MGIFVIGDGSLFHKILIDTDETNSVTAWYIWYSFDLTSHHENGSLDVLNVEIVFGSWGIVWSHDSDLLTSLDDSREDSTESIESTLVVGWHHLGDEDHEWTLLVAVLNGLTAWIINWTLIEIGSSVLLGNSWGWKFHDNHLKKSVSSVDPLLEDGLEEIFTLLFLVF
jgi:hypothetical protein